MTSSVQIFPQRKYSPGIMSGDILLPAFQVEGRSFADDFVRVPTRCGSMYRYKWAKKPYFFPTFDLEPPRSNEVLDQWMYEFRKLHNQLMDYIRRQGKQIIIIEVDDEDFLHGVLCSVCTLLNESESDWLIDHQFGTMYVVRHLDTLEQE